GFSRQSIGTRERCEHRNALLTESGVPETEREVGTLRQRCGRSALKGLCLLLALVGAVPVAAQNAPPDVPPGHWAYEAVRDLANKGLVKGYPDGKFLGKRTLTRYEMATIIQRLLQTVDDMVKA